MTRLRKSEKFRSTDGMRQLTVVTWRPLYGSDDINGQFFEKIAFALWLPVGYLEDNFWHPPKDIVDADFQEWISELGAGSVHRNSKNWYLQHTTNNPMRLLKNP